MAEVEVPLNQNIETLGMVIKYIQTFLQWVVVESGRIKDPDLQQQFSEGLPEVLVRLDSAATELLSAERPPTAIVAINDMCALGVCAGIRDAGLRVADDVSVIGFDDIVLADLAAPALTTIRQPLPEMAAAAFAHLRAGIESGEPIPGQSLLMRPELIVRASTAAVPT